MTLFVCWKASLQVQSNRPGKNIIDPEAITTFPSLSACSRYWLVFMGEISALLGCTLCAGPKKPLLAAALPSLLLWCKIRYIAWKKQIQLFLSHSLQVWLSQTFNFCLLLGCGIRKYWNEALPTFQLAIHTDDLVQCPSSPETQL